MIVIKLAGRMAALFASVCIGSTVTFLPTLTAQPPNGDGQKGNAGQAKPAAGKQGETDEDRLQGKWRILSIAIEDKVVKREDKRGAWKDTFGEDLQIRGDRLGQVRPNKGKFTLDRSRNPKQITIRDNDGKLTFRGIYDLDGNTLKVCINGDGTDVRRPEEFVTKKGAATVLITLEKRPAKD